MNNKLLIKLLSLLHDDNIIYEVIIEQKQITVYGKGFKSVLPTKLLKVCDN